MKYNIHNMNMDDRCVGSVLALEYNEKYVDNNVKLACYCPSCSKTEVREPTPYKILQTENGYVEIFDVSYESDASSEDEDEQDSKDAYDYEDREDTED